jgi:hypothetical protein
MGWRNFAGLALVAALAGCIEGKKSAPLKRVRAAAPAPVETKAQPGPPEPAEKPPDNPDKGKAD